MDDFKKLTEQLFKMYITAESVNDLGIEKYFDENISLIGTGKHEIYRNLHEFLESFKFDVKRRGCIVEHTNDGVACVDMIEKADADYYRMILMDIQMPIMNGYDATLAIRKMKDVKKSRIPIIAMTANAFAEDTHKALSVGMNDHVAKPVDMNILVPTMMKYL